jgi:hypothetical protein
VQSFAVKINAMVRWTPRSSLTGIRGSSKKTVFARRAFVAVLPCEIDTLSKVDEAMIYSNLLLLITPS